MILFAISLPFIALAAAQAIVSAIRFLRAAKDMPNSPQQIKIRAQKRYKNWKFALFVAFMASAAVALFVVYAAPFPFALTYFFGALLSAMLSCAESKTSVLRGMLWFPLMPFCPFRTKNKLPQCE